MVIYGDHDDDAADDDALLFAGRPELSRDPAREQQAVVEQSSSWEK